MHFLSQYSNRLVCLLLLKSVCLSFWIIYSGVGLSPDEAQYWTWSKALDWGYYSKPPGIAYQIFLGTALFSDTLFAVRFSSLILGFFLPLLLYAVARSCQLSCRVSYWAAVIFAFSPLGVFASVLSITDVGMIFFWILSLWAFFGFSKPNYYLMGVFIACGALFKWPIYILWLAVLMFIPFFPKLRNWHILGGVLTSLLGLIPCLIWNIKHDWVTFKHVASSIEGSPLKEGSVSIFSGNFLDFLGAQAALMSPLIFFLLLAAFVSIFKNRQKIAFPILFCAATTFMIMTLALSFSLFKKVQGNWIDYAYPTAFILVAWFVFEEVKWKKLLLYTAVTISVCLTSFVLTVPFLQSKSLFTKVQIPYRFSPFRHSVGWEGLEPILEKAGYHPSDAFLFSSKYQISSILSFYGPFKKRAYFFNIFGIRHNQFSVWPGMKQEQVGKNGYFVIAENEPYLSEHLDKISWYQETLLPYFRDVQFLGVYPLFSCYGKVCKAALLFKCVSYTGKEPGEVQLY